MQRRRFLVGGMGLAIGLAAGAVPWPLAAQVRGPVTNLPLPRFVSLKTSEGNARRGPSTAHRVDWIFTRRDMPLRVTAEFEHWRRVEDVEGLGGWMHHALLSGARTGLVVEDMAALRIQADSRAPVVAYLEAGVIGRIQRAGEGWCRFVAGGHRGWLPVAALWGVAPDEEIG